MSVSKKLALGFTIVLVLAAAVSIIGIIGMRSLEEAGSYMYERRVTSLSYVTSAKTAFDKTRLELRNLVNNSFFDDKKSSLDNNEEFEKSVLDFINLMEQSMDISDTKELLVFHTRILEQFNDYYLPCSRRIALLSISDIPEHSSKLFINAEMAYLATVIDKIESYINGLVELNSALAEQTDIDNARLSRIYVVSQMTLLVVAVIAAAIVARTIIKGIAEPIGEAVEVLGEIAKGNFNEEIKGDYKGEFEAIKSSVNYTAMQLAIYINETILAQEIVNDLNIEKARIEAASEVMFAGINYASSIQRNLLPPDSVFSEVFSDYSIIWKPRDIVGGDIYWLRNFEKGSLLCVCDCTGHGTPGALLTMLVSSTFDTMINEENCSDTAEAIYMLDSRLSGIMNANAISEKRAVKDGCDIAVLFIAKDGGVTISTAHMRVFICDGKSVTQIRGQNIYVGEGNLEGNEDVEVVEIPSNAENKFYIASDGLYDQGGGSNELPFGYKKFSELILDNHDKSQEYITQTIWDTFEEHRGDAERLDDLELISFRIKSQPNNKSEMNS